MSLVCSKCKKSLTVKESVLGTHQCGQLRPKATPRMMIRKTSDYVKAHFTELGKSGGGNPVTAERSRDFQTYVQGRKPIYKDDNRRSKKPP